MSKEKIEKCSKTRFKKGCIPPTARAVGHERVGLDGYVYVKVASHRKMVLKHRYVWEQHNGPIPAGMAVVFKDGNPLNCDIGNLELISRKELMRRNSYHTNYPEEVQRLIQLKGAINRQLNKKNKTSSTNKDYGTKNSRD